MTRILAAGLLGLAAILATVPAGRGMDAAATEKDIVDTALGAGQFKTLVTAVQAAGLVDTLKGHGPFTVFAPTDEAFAKVPREKLEALLKDKKALAAVLTYHVVPGKVLASDVDPADHCICSHLRNEQVPVVPAYHIENPCEQLRPGGRIAQLVRQTGHAAGIFG